MKGIPVMFKDRREAGRRLAELLEEYSGRDDVIVLGLPRGGVPVAWEVAQALKVPLDVFIVRKLGVPGQEELAMGAIASGGVRVMNDEVLNYLDIDQALIDEITAGEQIELEKREKLYRGNRGNRGNRPFPELRGRTVLLVDDGLATGSSMRAAIKALNYLSRLPSSLPCRWPLLKYAIASIEWEVTSPASALKLRSSSTPSACGIKTSPRPAIRRFANC